MAKAAPPPPVVPRPEIFPKVREILVDALVTVHRNEITPETCFMEEFGVEIMDEEAEKIQTVGELLQCVEEKLRNAKRSDR